MTFFWHAALMTAALLAASAAHADEALARKSGCIACHTMDKRLLGPSFKQVADKYRGQAEAAQQLAARIRSGSQGVWGAVPMPAQAQVAAADADALARWIAALP